MPSHNQNEKEPKPTMSQSFFRACVLILFGVIAIAIAIDFIARFWVWLVIIAVVAAGVYFGLAYRRSRRDRW
jgi:uncharacterized membrane protein YdbT with pleckstrin-like domain